MMFAVFSFKGKQYKVVEDQEIRVDLIDSPEEKKIVFDDVLLLSDNKNVVVGNPKVDGASVEAEVLGEVANDKVSILKFHAKKRYKRTLGHTQHYTLVKISKIKSNEK